MGRMYRTVTVAKSAVADLMHRLSSVDIGVKVIGLEGRYHTQRHDEALSKLLLLCETDSGLRYPVLGDERASNFDYTGATTSIGRKLHEHALRSILTQPSDWQSVVNTVIRDMNSCKTQNLAVIGEVNIFPRHLLPNLQLCYFQDFEAIRSWNANLEQRPPSNPPVKAAGVRDDIAIIGMSCRFPGANNLEEFWRLLCEKKSMRQELPADRFPTRMAFGSQGSEQIVWGNFIDDAAEFDNQFFHISSREAVSMDPQQRILLQVAYQAVESSGYFDEVPKTKSVGCFLGVGSVDYADNVASHAPNAFSALGTLRAFISGRISHYFDWTGPSITYDTACSSSAVAIHSACQAIQSGECSLALAGGVNVISSPKLHQNLSKAGFLSQNGECKPFDREANGYCRGEGAGILFLKKLSTAITDRDPIAGVIAASAVNQCGNASPITVPDSKAQIELFHRVTSIAGLKPSQIGYVEAHGTGTYVNPRPHSCMTVPDSSSIHNACDT